MDILFEKYNNIQTCIKKRNYETIEPFLDFQAFKKNIQSDTYIKIKCNDVKKGKNVYIYLFTETSIYINVTIQFKKLMSKLYDNEPSVVLLITQLPISVYINKSLIQFPQLTFFNYISKGPFCSEHIILLNDEVKNLCVNELIINPLGLPAISINDVQCIWIGAELGQVIKINAISEITGKTIKYRIVTPDSGKINNIQNLQKSIDDNQNIDKIKIDDSNSDKQDEIKDISNTADIINETGENDDFIDDSDIDE